MVNVGRFMVLLAAVPLAGCSFIFVDAPPSRAPRTERISSESELSCTTSKAAPIIDTIIAGLQGVRAGVAAAADDSAYDGLPISRGADITLGVGFMALFAASAGYGYVMTGKCKDLKGGAQLEDPPHRPDETTRETWTEPAPAQP